MDSIHCKKTQDSLGACPECGADCVDTLELREKIQELREKIQDLEERLEKLQEVEDRLPPLTHLVDSMKMEYFLEHFQEIPLEALEWIVQEMRNK